VWVPPVDLARLTDDGAEESSRVVRERVEAARARQAARAGDAGALRNAELPGRALRRVCTLPAGGRALLAGALRRRGLSARALHRVLRVARTLADLEGAESVELAHVAEAVRYRILPDGASDTGGAAVSARTASR
jgi:magnesium chelatase family protein